MNKQTSNKNHYNIDNNNDKIVIIIQQNISTSNQLNNTPTTKLNNQTAK